MTGSYGVESDENYATFETETLKMLRGKKNLFVDFSLNYERDYIQGEGTAINDYVRVYEVAE